MNLMKPPLCAIALATAVSLSACGKAPLTAEQKVVVADTIESIGKTRKAVPGVSQQSSRNKTFATLSPLNQFKIFAAIADPQEEEDDENYGQMVSTLTTAKNEGKCEIPEPTSDTSSTSSFSVKTEVTGDDCPITMSIDIAGASAATDSIKITANLSYSVKDSVSGNEYRAFNDIDAFNLTGDVSIDASGFTGEITGTINSQAKGEIAFNLDIDYSASGGSVTLTMDFADFSVELENSIASDGTATYTINGEASTAAEFNEYMSKAGVSSTEPTRN